MSLPTRTPRRSWHCGRRSTSWRWAGVPFLLRTGKRLARTATEIAVQFKLPPLQLFQTVECEGDLCIVSEQQPTILAFRIQPDEGISLSFSAKRPGMLMDLQPVCFDFEYGDRRPGIARGLRALAAGCAARRCDTVHALRRVEAAWKFVTPILEAWRRGAAAEVPQLCRGHVGSARG